jgi:DNA-binding XRE family transcriptional regulator
MEFGQELAVALRKRRAEIDKTQKEVSKLIGINSVTLNKLENVVEPIEVRDGTMLKVAKWLAKAI